MLGALIYHLRAYLSRDRPDPDFFSVLVRVFLGGFAGVVVGWYVPADIESLGTIGIKWTSITLAFLVGYSIDVFLSLLDRIVAGLSGWVRGIGAQQKS